MDVLRKMFEASRLLRCFFKGSINSPLLQFSERSEQKSDSSDFGDGGGIPVYAFLSISSHGMIESKSISCINHLC